MIHLTDLEKAILEFALEKGCLSQTDFQNAYSNTYAKRNCIKKFLSIGFIKSDVGDKFKIDVELIEKCIK